MSIILNTLICVMSILISVAFYTLLERKILSYIQTRKGPNKISIMGMMQPISDAIKLFNKNLMWPTNSNKLIFMLSPTLTFLMSTIIWPLIPLNKFNLLDCQYNSIIFFITSSLLVYTMMLTGWSANSKYSNLGIIRSIAQMISYEINFFMILITMIMLFHSFSFSNFSLPQKTLIMILGNMPIMLMWCMTCLAELNRSPFDFAEGESELVSGFNIEFMSSMFALIMLSEYLNIILLSLISTMMFAGNMSTLWLLTFFMMFFLWIRGTLPRMRYDILMTSNWKILLPLTTTLLMTTTLFSYQNF